MYRDSIAHFILCALHTYSGVRLETLFAHHYWCDLHTLIFTVHSMMAPRPILQVCVRGQHLTVKYLSLLVTIFYQIFKF